MLKTLFSSYWEVCLLRRSPADTPYSWLLLGTFSVFYFLLMQLQWHYQALPAEYTVKDPVLSGALLMIANFIYLGALFALLSKSNRFVQTTTSIMAVHTIMHILLMPLILIMSHLIVFPSSANVEVYEQSAGNLFLMIIMGVVSLVITIWQLVVIIYIFRKSIEADQFKAVMAMFGLLAFSNLFASIMSVLL